MAYYRTTQPEDDREYPQVTSAFPRPYVPR